MLFVTLCRSLLASNFSSSKRAAVLKDEFAEGYNLLMKQLLTFPSKDSHPKSERRGVRMSH